MLYTEQIIFVHVPQYLKSETYVNWEHFSILLIPTGYRLLNVYFKIQALVSHKNNISISDLVHFGTNV